MFVRNDKYLGNLINKWSKVIPEGKSTYESFIQQYAMGIAYQLIFDSMRLHPELRDKRGIEDKADKLAKRLTNGVQIELKTDSIAKMSDK